MNKEACSCFSVKRFAILLYDGTLTAGAGSNCVPDLSFQFKLSDLQLMYVTAEDWEDIPCRVRLSCKGLLYTTSDVPDIQLVWLLMMYSSCSC
jgi:hypothetical protein